jgi:glutathione S-transferase
VARFWKHFFDQLTPQQEANLPDIMKKGYAALDVMERHLATNSFCVGNRYGLADIALYAYTHAAHEGEFDLSRYPHITAWLARVKAQPGYISIEHKH